MLGKPWQHITKSTNVGMFVVLCLFESAQPIPDNVKSRYYELNAEKLRDFWHYAMLRGLIKVRARELLSFLPNIEKIVYWQCEKDAKSAVALAKCAVRVFDATENARRKEENSKLRKSGVITSFSARLSKPQPWIGTYGYSESLGSPHLKNLRLIRDHFKRVEKVNSYFKQMNEENRRLFEKVALPIDSRTPEITNNAVPAIEQVLAIMNEFAATKADNGKLSVLSPRVLSLFPDSPKSSSKRLLSPTFFSFQKDGYLSLPELFDIITTNQKYQQLMVDVLMDISGAGDVLEKLIVDMKPEMDDLKNVKLPLVEELSKKDTDWMRVHDSFDEEQTRYYTEHGYAFLNEHQLNLIYSKDEQQLYGMNTSKLGLMSDAEKAQRLENDIRKLAALDRPQWPTWDEGAKNYIPSPHSIVKRHTHATNSISSNVDEKSTGGSENHEEERVNGVLYETFRPFAFTTLLARGGVMEVATLSPHAFVTELANPEALVLQTLSPRAFVASILSPAALIARILSPTALRAEVLSPRALHSWVLSPEAMVAEVLSPRFFDPRVLSPEALVIDVLSPGFLSPHVLSSEIGGVIILSPNILSPRVASEEKLLVEVLSPHILGGHESREEESREKEADARRPTHNSTHSYPHIITDMRK
ncbi:hypothetical protein RB195_021593 [Necator americanus]|uniref:Uncharacterized protein n=1 Tax=Necator americanus TaxID=51031 RepID=A0ABR1EBW2_NECAM